MEFVKKEEFDKLEDQYLKLKEELDEIKKAYLKKSDLVPLDYVTKEVRKNSLKRIVSTRQKHLEKLEGWGWERAHSLGYIYPPDDFDEED